MKKYLFSVLFTVTVSSVFLSSCKKECDESSRASMNLNFYPMVDSNELVYNQQYMVNGRKLKFTKAQFYVSGITFKKGDNIPVDPEMKYALVHAAEISYNIGTIDNGNYHLLEFAVGVDSAANHGDPSFWNASHPLYVNSLYSSYWDWSQGYVFMKIEGYVDTSAAANGDPTTGFAYHIGNDEMLRTISLSINEDIQGSERFVEVNVDYARLLENVDFQTELQTHSTGNQALAQKIADKAQEAIAIK